MTVLLDAHPEHQSNAKLGTQFRFAYYQLQNHTICISSITGLSASLGASYCIAQYMYVYRQVGHGRDSHWSYTEQTVSFRPSILTCVPFMLHARAAAIAPGSIDDVQCSQTSGFKLRTDLYRGTYI